MRALNGRLNGEWGAHVKGYEKRVTSKARRQDAKSRRSVEPSVADWEDYLRGRARGFWESLWFCDCCEDKGCTCCIPEIDELPKFRLGEHVAEVDRNGNFIQFAVVVGVPVFREFYDGDSMRVVETDYELGVVNQVRGWPTWKVSGWLLKKLGLLETLAVASL